MEASVWRAWGGAGVAWKGPPHLPCWGLGATLPLLPKGGRGEGPRLWGPGGCRQTPGRPRRTPARPRARPPGSEGKPGDHGVWATCSQTRAPAPQPGLGSLALGRNDTAWRFGLQIPGRAAATRASQPPSLWRQGREPPAPAPGAFVPWAPLSMDLEVPARPGSWDVDKAGSLIRTAELFPPEVERGSGVGWVVWGRRKGAPVSTGGGVPMPLPGAGVLSAGGVAGGRQGP